MAAHATLQKVSSSVGESSAQFMRQVGELVKDYMTPNMAIYWTDLLVTFAISQIALFFYLSSSLFSVPFFLSFVVAWFALYRGIVFSHELAHLRKGAGRRFRIAWNALFGIPSMFPLFMYDDHKIHHVNHTFGTDHDPEYLAFARGPWREIVDYMLRVLIVPISAIVRFLIAAPITWVFPAARTWVWQRTSPIFTINFKYRRDLAGEEENFRSWIFQEVCCFLYGCAFLGLIIAGYLPWTVLPKIYVLFVFVSGLNYLRVLGAHRWISEGEPSSYLGQLLDSYTITSNPIIGELWAPLGTRYHALHHMIPSMPYHHMHRAHLHLLERLPDDSPYRRTIRPSLWSALVEVSQHARGGAVPTP